jgi:hypothetical protein
MTCLARLLVAILLYMHQQFKCSAGRNQPLSDRQKRAPNGRVLDVEGAVACSGNRGSNHEKEKETR